MALKDYGFEVKASIYQRCLEFSDLLKKTVCSNYIDDLISQSLKYKRNLENDNFTMTSNGKKEAFINCDSCLPYQLIIVRLSKYRSEWNT
ncbi:Mediator of RNA polymerase II transcription subunit [Dirofilaria immitis]